MIVPMKSEIAYFCPVCGYPGITEPPYMENEAGSFEICPCCFVEFGNDDGGRSGEDLQLWLSEARNTWITQGMSWHSSSATTPPADWNPLVQLENIKLDRGPAAGLNRYRFD